MRVSLLVLLLTVAGFSTGRASAQVWIQPYPPPWPPVLWQPQPFFPPVAWNGWGFQQFGWLPNGTPVYNPWGRWIARPVWPVWPVVNPGFSVAYSYQWGPWGNYSFFGNVGVGFPQPVFPYVQQEPGRFQLVAADTAVNPVTGTVLRPWQGVAYTREGPFYRVPGSGSLTAFGAYIPGTGLYLNPVTGATYNPASGLIVR